MTNAQQTAMLLALTAIQKPEDIEARLSLISGKDLTESDCRALIVACYRSGIACQADLSELAEWFFDRYDIDLKPKVMACGRVVF